MALSNLYIFNYNTYFNRIVKREATFEDYGEPMFVMEGVNFNIADGVDTQVIWGKSTQSYHGQGNYLIEYDDDYGMLLSRWFITDANFNRQGQWVLTLRRDLLADYYNNVIEAPMMVNRGMVNHTNPLVFNDEGFSFNEIKVEERLLQNHQNFFPYIVLYCSKTMSDRTDIPVEAEWTPNADIVLPTTIDNSIYAPGLYTSLAQEGYIYYTSNLTLKVPNSSLEYYKKFEYKSSNSSYSITGAANYPTVDSRYGKVTFTGTDTQVKNALIASINNHMGTYQNDYRLSQVGKITEATRAIYEERLNKYTVIKDSSGRYYNMYITKNVSGYKSDNVASTSVMYGDLTTYINTYFTNTSYNNNSFDFYYKEYMYTIIVTPLDDYTFNASVTPSTHNMTNDSECNIILLPYEDLKLVYAVDPETGIESWESISKEDQLNIARSIARAYTNTVIYDMQLLPYAPYQNVTSNDKLYYTDLDEKEYELIKYEGATKGILLYTSISNFTFDIPVVFNVENYTDNQAINYKIESNCTKHRLCSPNYSGMFEWNNAKNNGTSHFNVDVTYRPYNPYIHINPNFKGIYGTDYDDARGLICQGDFSLPITGDAFAQYELNNKNYLNVFNRDIQHMEFSQRQERIASGFQVGVGTVQGGVTGAAAGGSVGGVYGAIAGAVVGAGASLGGGIADIQMMNARQREDRAYAKDMFAYQLGNIKALPYSLNKVTPLTWNNKIFPFVEVYTCTSEEKEILRNRVKYDSMKLECIDTLENLMLNYTEDSDIHFYSGNIIRIEGVDNHESEAIYEEIKKGAYF